MDCPIRMRAIRVDHTGKIKPFGDEKPRRPRNEVESEDDEYIHRPRRGRIPQSRTAGLERPYGCNIDVDSENDTNDDGDASTSNTSSDTTNRHYIQVILQNGRLSNITTEPPAPQQAQNSNSATNSLQCVIGIRSISIILICTIRFFLKISFVLLYNS